MSKTFAVLAAALCSASLAHASSTFIDFEAIPNGGTVSNEYPGVMFSSSGTVVEVSDYGSTWGTSGPKIACPLGDARGYCSASLTVDFLTLVTSVGYLYTGDDDAGLVGRAAYYGVGGVLLATHDLFGDADASTAHADSFAFAGGITQLVITVSDVEAGLQGLGYDDFRLAPVPEPHAYALMLAGLAAIGGLARRRR